MTYQIGQIVPHTKPRGLTGHNIGGPVWFALTVPGGKENAARGMLEANGIHAQYPTREVRHRQRGKQIVRKLPIITRVIYAQFHHQPQWDVMKGRRMITGVYSRDGWPIEIPYDVVRSVMGLPTIAEELEQARREMLRPREGGNARVVDGPLAGFLVDVRRVSHGRVWFETVTGIKGDADMSNLVRDA